MEANSDSNNGGEAVKVDLRVSQPFLFLKFSQLPREIRDLIWESTLPDARVIEVYAKSPYNHGGLVCRLPSVNRKRSDRCGCHHIHTASGKWQEFRPRYYPEKCPNPALSVCRESREVALNNYRWCFTSRSPREDQDRLPWQSGITPCCKSWTPGILFQPKKDIIRLRLENAVQGVDIERAIISAFADELDCSSIRSLAIDDKLFQDVPLFVALFQGNDRTRSALMKGLKEVFVIPTWWKSPVGSSQGNWEKFQKLVPVWKTFFENNTTVTPVPAFSYVDEHMLPVQTWEKQETIDFNQFVRNLVNGGEEVD